MAPALHEVGRQWEIGRLPVALEHRFTQKIQDALHALRHSLPLPGETARRGRALVACAEDCLHEIGAMFIRICLEKAGWEVTYLGANVPYEECASIQEAQGFELLALSFVPPLSAADLRRGLKVLGALYRPEFPYRLALGGGSLSSTVPLEGFLPFREVKIAGSAESFERWLTTIPP